MGARWWRTPADRFTDFITPRLDHMYRVAYRFCGNRDDTEDLVQDVVLKLTGRVRELEALDQPEAWLTRVIYRSFVDFHRHRRRQRTVSLSVVGEDATESADWIDDDGEREIDDIYQSELQQLIHQALAGLAPDQRALVVLADMEDTPLHDIAMILEIPLGTVKSRLHRTRALLRQRLENKLEPATGPRRVNY